MKPNAKVYGPTAVFLSFQSHITLQLWLRIGQNIGPFAQVRPASMALDAKDLLFGE